MLRAAFIFATVIATVAAAMAQIGSYTPPESSKSAVTPPVKVRVIDARTFADIHTGETFRLFAVDVCSIEQTANLDGQSWPCGVISTAWLVQQTLGQWVICNRVHAQPGLTLARCATARLLDLAASMIREGMAVTIHDPDIATPAEYNQLDVEARHGFRGLWRSQFLMPWEYRSQRMLRPEGDPQK
jgi:endonuclease YncB( thermonuclease family)